MISLGKELSDLSQGAFANRQTSEDFFERLKEPGLTRAENESSHFAVMFLPYNPVTNQVFMVHHKKSGLWIAPGGHIEPGESLLETLWREIKEELGVVEKHPRSLSPFLATAMDVNNPGNACRRHFDLWYLYETDGKNFKVDPREFYQTKWLTWSETRQLVTNKENLLALEKVFGH